jgi:hypothetical protein
MVTGQGCGESGKLSHVLISPSVPPTQTLGIHVIKRRSPSKQIKNDTTNSNLELMGLTSRQLESDLIPDLCAFIQPFGKQSLLEGEACRIYTCVGKF